jgi:hypothetical protein
MRCPSGAIEELDEQRTFGAELILEDYSGDKRPDNAKGFNQGAKIAGVSVQVEICTAPWLKA